MCSTPFVALLRDHWLVASQELPYEGASLFRDSTLTDDPSKYSVYEVELIERWAQGSLLILGDAGTVGCLSAQVRQVQCPYRL